VSSTTRLSDNKISFCQINDHQFLIEGHITKTKIGGESEYAISYIDIANGPYLHIGRDFLGRGKIQTIQIVDTESYDYIMIKVTIND